MCYRCSICSTVVPPGTPLLKHIEYREDFSIEREVNVCPSCKKDLETESLCGLLRFHRLNRAERATAVVYADAPAPPKTAKKLVSAGIHGIVPPAVSALFGKARNGKPNAKAKGSGRKRQ